MSLNEVKLCQSCTIHQTPYLPLLASLGLRPGAKITIVCRQPLHGPVIVRLGQRCLALSRELADQILVGEAA